MTTAGAVRLSIAMCTYNGQRHLPAQLESIVAQSRPPDEMVVRDDGSHDGTPALLEQFKATAPFPVTLELDRRRVGSTAGFGEVVGRCTGDVIALADQDDVWLPDKLATVRGAFESDPQLTMLFHDSTVVSKTGRLLHPSVWWLNDFRRRRRAAFEADPLRALLSRPFCSGSTIAFRRGATRVLLPFPDVLRDSSAPMMHDHWISLVLAALGGVVALDRPLIDYRRHPDQQIGIPWYHMRRVLPPSFWGLRELTVSRSRRDRRLSSLSLQLAALTDRLEAEGTTSPVGDQIAEYRAHLAARVALPRARIRRVRAIRDESRTGRYRAFSHGALTAVADLVR